MILSTSKPSIYPPVYLCNTLGIMLQVTNKLINRLSRKIVVIWIKVEESLFESSQNNINSYLVWNFTSLREYIIKIYRDFRNQFSNDGGGK